MHLQLCTRYLDCFGSRRDIPCHVEKQGETHTCMLDKIDTDYREPTEYLFAATPLTLVNPTAIGRVHASCTLMPTCILHGIQLPHVRQGSGAKMYARMRWILMFYSRRNMPLDSLWNSTPGLFLIPPFKKSLRLGVPEQSPRCRVV